MLLHEVALEACEWKELLYNVEFERDEVWLTLANLVVSFFVFFAKEHAERGA